MLRPKLENSRFTEALHLYARQSTRFTRHWMGLGYLLNINCCLIFCFRESKLSTKIVHRWLLKTVITTNFRNQRLNKQKYCSSETHASASCLHTRTRRYWLSDRWDHSQAMKTRIDIIRNCLFKMRDILCKREFNLESRIRFWR